MLRKYLLFIAVSHFLTVAFTQSVKINLDTIEYIEIKKNNEDVPRIELKNMYRNVLIGRSAGRNISPQNINGEGSSNVFIGYFAGRDNTLGAFNTFIGNASGVGNITGSNNVGIGAGTAGNLLQGSGNTFVGNSAGFSGQSGLNNVMLGTATGESQTSGNDNVYVGYNAGGGSVYHSKRGNVMIGYRAGRSDTTNNKLYIENSSADSTTALIYGDFFNDFLTVNGKFGVNKTSPQYALDVFGNGQLETEGTTTFGLKTNAANKRAMMIFGYDDGHGWIEWGQIGKFFGSQALKIRSENEMSLDVRGEPAIFIDTTGNIGIGTQNPSVDLVVNGDMHVGEMLAVKDFTQRIGIGTLAPQTRVHVSTVQDAILRLEVRDTTSNNIAGMEFGHFNGVNFRESGRIGRKVDGSEDISIISVNDLEIGAGDAAALFVKDNGRVGIGINEPTTNLHLVHGNNANVGGLRLENSNNGNWWRFYARSNANILSLYNNNGGLVGEFDDAGNYGTPSDRRRKRDITALPYGLQTLAMLQPKRYQFNHQTVEDPRYHLGFIAQEVASVVPEIVNYSEEDDTYTLNYQGFSVIAIQALKEQQEIISTQQQQIDALTAQMSEVLSQLTLLKDQTED